MAEDEKKANSFDRLFRQGTRLLHEGQASQAAALLERAHRLNPGHIDAAINLSGAYILSGKFKWAAALLESTAEREPNNVHVWTNLGAAYLGNPVLARDEEQNKAIAAFKQALAISPAAPHVAYNIGLIYRDRQEIDKAVAWFRLAIQADPDDQDAHRILARLTAVRESD